LVEKQVQIENELFLVKIGVKNADKSKYKIKILAYLDLVFIPPKSSDKIYHFFCQKMNISKEQKISTKDLFRPEFWFLRLNQFPKSVVQAPSNLSRKFLKNHEQNKNAKFMFSRKKSCEMIFSEKIPDRKMT